MVSSFGHGFSIISGGPDWEAEINHRLKAQKGIRPANSQQKFKINMHP